MAGINDFTKGWIKGTTGSYIADSDVGVSTITTSSANVVYVQPNPTAFPWDDPQHKPEPFEDVLRLKKQAMAFRDMMEYVDVEFKRRIYGKGK